jgi:hypothetical protein
MNEEEGSERIANCGGDDNVCTMCCTGRPGKGGDLPVYYMYLDIFIIFISSRIIYSESYFAFGFTIKCRMMVR